MSGKRASINGLPVKDATKSVILHITENDIRKSDLKDPNKCAAAVACKRQLGATDVRVHLGRTYIRYNGQWKRYITSGRLRSEVVAFDRGGKFEPGDYLLVKMQPSREKDTRRHRPNGGRGKKRMKWKMIANVRPVGIYA